MCRDKGAMLLRAVLANSRAWESQKGGGPVDGVHFRDEVHRVLLMG